MNENFDGKRVMGVLDIVLGVIISIVGLWGANILEEFDVFVLDYKEEMLFMELTLALGVIFIISGIVTLSFANAQEMKYIQSKQDNMHHVYQHNLGPKIQQKQCSKCQELNSINASYCRFCNSRLDKVNKTVSISNDAWECPKCGTVNQNYVGTCGCGEVKPR